MQHANVVAFVTAQIAHLADSIPLSAIGLTGSASAGQPDQFSDIDICVYVESDIPPFDARQNAYAALGFTEFIYQDVDFEFSWGDGLRVAGVRVDFNWMNIAVIEDFLRGLTIDFDCAEWIPGGTARVQVLHDPDGTIARLQRAIPRYPAERARHRITGALNSAHRTLYDLDWLNKAAFRADHFSFLKYEYTLFEDLFRCLFALNHVWLADEKRLTQRLTDLAHKPANATQRIEQIILRQADCHTLTGSLTAIRSLFADTAACVRQRYPDLAIPRHITHPPDQVPNGAQKTSGRRRRDR